mgnify:CR=1 FL=1
MPEFGCVFCVVAADGPDVSNWRHACCRSHKFTFVRATWAGNLSARGDRTTNCRDAQSVLQFEDLIFCGRPREIIVGQISGPNQGRGFDPIEMTAQNETRFRCACVFGTDGLNIVENGQDPAVKLGYLLILVAFIKA